MQENVSSTRLEEKRMDKRFQCEALINWSYFNEDRSFDARIFNFSRNGVYIETRDRIRPNTTILIRLEALITDGMMLSGKESLRIVSLGDVKWCSELSKEHSIYYGSGVRYCRLK